MSLATSAGLAKRWGISRQRVDQLAARPDFPAGLKVEGAGKPTTVYAIEACEQWWQENRPERSDYMEKRWTA